MIALLLLYLPACFVNATIAEQKGRSYWGVFFLSLVFSPLLGWGYIAAVPPR